MKSIAIFIYEWKHFIRSPFKIVSIILFVIAAVYGLHNGANLYQDQISEIDNRVKEINALLELTGLENRKITEISGGQQQRVALARCLVKKPKLLLLDEPLAALDKKLRVQTQFELVNLQYKLGITFIIVTHDQEEAMSLSDRMAIMKEGNILQVGNPVEVYEKPSERKARELAESTRRVRKLMRKRLEREETSPSTERPRW